MCHYCQRQIILTINNTFEDHIFQLLCCGVTLCSRCILNRFIDNICPNCHYPAFYAYDPVFRMLVLKVFNERELHFQIFFQKAQKMRVKKSNSFFIYMDFLENGSAHVAITQMSALCTFPDASANSTR